MEANCPQQVATPVAASPETTEGLATAVLDRIGQLVCGMHGHDEILQFEDSRIFLRCVSCGHESPGWQMPERAPVLKFAGAARPHARATEAAPAKRVA
jgi:hypothetical protein